MFGNMNVQNFIYIPSEILLIEFFRKQINSILDVSDFECKWFPTENV